VRVGHHAVHLAPGARLEPVQAGLQQADVAAKTVDDEALHPRLLARGKQFQGSDQVGEHTAAVDVGDQHHRHVGRLGKAHVGDVAVAQVDLGRAACPLHQHGVVGGAQPAPALHHGGHRGGLVGVVIARRQVRRGAPVDDDLGADVARGLEQHRVEVGVRHNASGQGLQRLGTTDLATVGGDR